jgi:hypothetical protein
MADKLFGPVGRCIYCGATKYAPGSQRPLAREHIIPEGISGDLVLLEASCRRCELKINPWETRLIKGALLGCKTHLGLATKRPSGRPTSLPLFDPRVHRRTGTTERKVMIPIKDYPISVLLVRFDAPRIFNPASSHNLLDGGWLYGFTDIQWDVLEQKYDLPEFGTSSLDTWALCRSLAKMGHAFAVAKFGMNGFVPTLPNFIMGDYDAIRLYYVGGSLADEPASEKLHEIGFETPDTIQWQYIVVRIRLFAKYGGPVYRIVAGKRIRPNKPAGVLLEEAIAGRNSDRMIFGYPSSPPIPEGLWDPNAPSSGAAPARGQARFVRVKANPPPQ